MLVLLVFFATSNSASASTIERPAKNRGAQAVEISKGQRLSAHGKSLLDFVIDGATLPDLDRPSFEDLKGETREFYDLLHDSLAWVAHSKPTRQALAMIHLLKIADEKGLKPEDYDSPRWDSRLARMEQPDPLREAHLVVFDVALTVSVMRYISDLNIGRVNPRLFHFELDIHDRRIDLSEFLKRMLASGSDIGSRVQDVEPPFPAYRRTILALKKYRELAREDDGEPLPSAAKTIQPGDPYMGVSRLLRLLRLLGDLPSGATAPSSTVYQGTLPEAVRHFQGRHGIESTGLIDEETLQALNTPIARRVTQLELTLERWRWAPREFVRPPVVVNIPEFRVRADDEKYHWVLSMKVVVGRAFGHKTPVFASEIRSVIFRPYWNVPLAIQREEFIPKIEENPAYLAENSYDIVDSDGSVVDEDPSRDEVREKLRTGQLGVRQRPGPDNALGLVKFDFPNQFDVYMHGTPSTELFSKSRRDFSHGCIRVEDPVSLSQWILRDRPEWTAENIRNAMYGETTVRVALLKPIPVLIVYGTAVVMEDGEVRFFDDIYGHDAALERALTLDDSRQ
ncbi:MAG TPA: L,D-transpeptidase family protein [Candidatus Acidoferrum sp.]|nr:L,D-transpeptidase family protein [Candidatus Acidoferrum sp.]